MVLQQRTALMVAATYGSLDMMRLIVAARPAVDVSRSCFPNGSTTLHCAVSGGSLDTVETVRMLLAVGADVTAVDSGGHRPLDVVISPPKWELPTVENSILASTNDLRHERHPTINLEKVKAAAQGLAYIGKAFALATTIVFGVPLWPS